MAKTCWLWYEWATVTGNGDALPIIQSPPTPTWSPKPDFTFDYVGVTTCGAVKFIRLQVVNTGNLAWESFRIVAQDTVTTDTMSVQYNAFVDYSGCSHPGGVTAIAPGATNYAVGLAPAGSGGHNVEVTLHLFTADNSGGTHMSGNINFTMP